MFAQWRGATGRLSELPPTQIASHADGNQNMNGWALLLSLLVYSDVEPSHLQAAFSEDFRRGEFDVGKLQLRGVMGKGENQVVKLTHDGLRIVLPARHGERLFAGISTKFHIRGDFEITTAFQILVLDRPETGTGAGALLHVDLLDSPTKEAFSLGRFARPKEGNVFFALRARTGEDEKRQWATRNQPTQATTGKLRLVREGTTIRYLVAEGESDQFQQVDEARIGTEDLEAVRLTAETSGAPGGSRSRFAISRSDAISSSGLCLLRRSNPQI